MNPYTVLAVIAVYFIVIYTISYISSRKVDNAGFFVGNRQSSWYVVAFAMISSSISGITFISVPGMVAEKSFSYLQMNLGFVVGQFTIAFVLVPLFYRMNVVSIYEYLENRFGMSSYKTGAWFFFVSKMLGASVRLFLVCVVLQLLVFEPLNIHFIFNVIFTIGLVWLYTFQGGVKTLIWTDTLKSVCLIVSLALCIYFLASSLNYTPVTMVSSIFDHKYSQMFFFDDVNDKRFFFKQFLAGVFVMIAMTGLDQDMMQRNLSCKNSKDSQKNMVISVISQFFIIVLFLMLGVLSYTFAELNGITVEKSDQLFPKIATGGYFPMIVGILFIVGLISAAYSAAGSALTALTTSFTIDILGATRKNGEAGVKRIRMATHIAMTVVMGIVIIIFEALNKTSVVDAVYILASYTYGPILGMFAFGILNKSKIKDKYIPYIAIAAPIVCYILDKNSVEWFNGYQFSYELLIMNALFVYIGMWFIKKR